MTTRTGPGRMSSVATLFDTHVALGQADPCAPAPPLFPDELRAMAGATRKRRREFAAGRTAARMAMAQLSLPPVAIPMAPDRAPVWPAGVLGSISHDRQTCLAVVARATSGLRGLGLDIEPMDPLAADLWPEICRPAELDYLHRQPPENRGLWARMLFCAKEAAYKAHYPLTRTMTDFHALEVTLSPSRFTARLCQPLPGFATGSELTGRLGLAGGAIVAGVTL